jgi:hypothetical protein
MVIGCLLTLRRVLTPLAPPPTVPAAADVPPWFVSPPGGGLDRASPRAAGPGAAAALDPGAYEEVELKAGRFSAVRSLLRALRRGREAKSALDLVLDACAAMQNLREAIASYRTRLHFETNDMRRQALLQVRAARCFRRNQALFVFNY